MRIRPVVLGAFTTTALVVSVLAQAPAERPVFEVVSVKVNVANAPGGTGLLPGGRFVARGALLGSLVRMAYEPFSEVPALPPFQLVGGPDWMQGQRFDVTATASGEVATLQMRRMLQALLADRFKLVVHHESRELPIYRLVVARDDGHLGNALKPTTTDCNGSHGDALRPMPVGVGVTCGYFGISLDIPVASGQSNQSFRGITLDALAHHLEQFVQRHVTNETGLNGYYDGDFEFTAEIPIPPPPPGLPNPYAGRTLGSIFSVLPAQLGLRLEPTRGPVDVLVIDHVERPTED